MSHITYHYLLGSGDKTSVNKTMDLKGKYLYDLNYNPDKKKQEKIYKHYLDNFLSMAPEELVKECKKRNGLKAQANYGFEYRYKQDIEPVLGKPYQGIFGLYTTPVNLPKSCYRLRIDLDTIDPDVIIIRLGKDIVKYNEANWNRYCKPFIDNDETILDYLQTGSFKSLPSVVIYLPRLKFLPEDIEFYNNSITYYRVVDPETKTGIYNAVKNKVSLDVWKRLLELPEINWLPKPKNSYADVDNYISFFTKKGLDKFTKLTLPILKNIIPNVKILKTKTLPGKIMYNDEYQVVVKL